MLWIHLITVSHNILETWQLVWHELWNYLINYSFNYQFLLPFSFWIQLACCHFLFRCDCVTLWQISYSFMFWISCWCVMSIYRCAVSFHDTALGFVQCQKQKTGTDRTFSFQQFNHIKYFFFLLNWGISNFTVAQSS